MQVAWTIANLVTKGSSYQLRQLLIQGLLPSFCRLLGPNSADVKQLLTSKVIKILNDAEKTSDWAKQVIIIIEYDQECDF